MALNGRYKDKKRRTGMAPVYVVRCLCLLFVFSTTPVPSSNEPTIAQQATCPLGRSFLDKEMIMGF